MTVAKTQDLWDYLVKTERIRYHEASHALFMYFYGFRPKVMRLGAEPIVLYDRRMTAFFRQQSPWNSKQRAQVERYALISAVGVLAEYKRNSSVPVSELWLTAGVYDLEQLYELLVGYGVTIAREGYPSAQRWPNRSSVGSAGLAAFSRSPSSGVPSQGLAEESYNYDSLEIGR